MPDTVNTRMKTNHLSTLRELLTGQRLTAGSNICLAGRPLASGYGGLELKGAHLAQAK